MSDQPVLSRIARRLVERGRIPDDPSFRHGTEDVARVCASGPTGGKCEVCRRAFPDNAKKHRMNVRARRTSSCTYGGSVGHGRCGGWRFASGVSADTAHTRGASECTCPCHADGRGKPIPPFEEWIEERRKDEEEHARRQRERVSIKEEGVQE